GLAIWLWRIEPYRFRRSFAALGILVCLAGITGVSLAAPGNFWEIFSRNNYVSKFSRSAVTAYDELLTHGIIEADATASPPLSTAPFTCNPAVKLPHVILIHDESSYDIRAAKGIKVPEGYGSHFVSYDGKARKLLTESNGGSSWYAEFNVLVGLSARSFGRFAYFLPRVVAGRFHRGLPLSLERCGYRTYSFYPAAGGFMSARAFQTSAGVQHFYDYTEMGTNEVEPDSFYYNAAATKLREERGTGPMFAYVYLDANHFPFSRSWHPDLMPGWQDLGNTPEVDEYLRRQARSVQDYQAFVQRLKRDFPGESFMLVRYGDHEPAFPTFIMDPDLDRATIAKRMEAHDPRYYTTYYTIDTINYDPPNMAAAPDTLDAPYIPMVIQNVIGLPLDPSFAEQQKIFDRCAGLFYACAGGAEARRFNRLLMDAGQLDRL
ncbi:MAG: sulfatase-like hydrolase/transferase, partial [Pseudolabrys sp.]|nr:sulfatase-like hydrolase/transferase [Pseudolabrys sp.]